MTERRTALVTGASSGIGLACAERLLADGYHVVGASRRGDVPQLAGDGFTPLALDLAELDAIEPALRSALEDRPVDCLVHAAGAGLFGSIEQFSVAQIDASLRLNLGSALILGRTLVPRMRRAGRGQLIFIGSEAALEAGRKGALYGAAKHGLRGFCRALREDCAAAGIRVSLINPGMVRSAFFDALDFAPGPAAENAIEVGDVAALVAQILASSEAIVIDEITLSPRIKSIDFSTGPKR